MARPPSSDDEGLTRAVRRAVGGALDATVGRVGERVTDTAREVTGTTARQVIEDLEPYLIEQAVPRIVTGLTPYLVQSVVPDVLEGITDHLVEVTVPEIVDGVNGHLVDVTVPTVVAGVTPQLVDELLPRILADLRPYLEQELVPRIVDALMPHLEEVVAPQLVDALLPKIRTEVVPTVLDDIVDDPRVRDLIREQSQGLFLDALERVRQGVADLDDVAELIGRRLLLQRRRPALGPQDLVPPHGRDHAFAGVVTRAAALAIDLTAAGWLISQGLSALLNVLTSLLGTLPSWSVAGLTLVAAGIAPTYLGLAYATAGRTVGMAIVGIRVCLADGSRPGLGRSLTKAWVGLLGVVVWVVAMIPSLFDTRRRGWLDRVTGTEVRYFVHESQQQRHVRAARFDQRDTGRAALVGAPGTPAAPPGGTTAP